MVRKERFWKMKKMSRWREFEVEICLMRVKRNEYSRSIMLRC